MNIRDGLIQQLRELRVTESALRGHLVDPVSELIVLDERRKRMFYIEPVDYQAAHEVMTLITFLRQVIRDLLMPLIDTQKQIRQIEDALRQNPTATSPNGLESPANN